MVADALSHRDAEDDSAHAISGPTFGLLDDIHSTTMISNDSSHLLQQLQADDLAAPWCLMDSVLLHGSHVFVPTLGDLHHQVLLLAHTASHEGIQKMLHHLRADFYIPGDTTLVRDFIRAYSMCQCNKTETLQPAGLLQPLDVPS
jgi:hypothetical protein